MKGLFIIIAVLALTPFTAPAAGPRQPLSDDRDLKELDLSHWDCLNKPDGSARTPDGQERNRLKNRSAPEGPVHMAFDGDVAGFLQHIADFEAMARGAKRKDINPGQREKLEPLEKQAVSVTGYIQLFYVGPPETTNCGSGEFHDWHLEVMDKPVDHPPQAGDPTPIVCEITPRTQNAIYKDGIRLQELANFFRPTDFSYQATGHKPIKVRLTGYLLWDDEHNGAADVGTAIKTAPPLKFHNPWRQAAWEIHPVYKIERLDGSAPLHHPEATTPPPEAGASPAQTTSAPGPPPTESAPPAPTAAPVVATPPPTPAQMVTIQIPLKIPTPQGEAIIPRGARLPVVSHDSQNVTVQYMGQTVIIPNGYIQR